MLSWENTEIMKVQGEIVCTGEESAPVGISIYCLYLKKKPMNGHVSKGQNNI